MIYDGKIRWVSYLHVIIMEMSGSTGCVIHYVPILICDKLVLCHIMLVLYPYSFIPQFITIKYNVFIYSLTIFIPQGWYVKVAVHYQLRSFLEGRAGN